MKKLKQLQIKSRRNGFNGIWTHDLRDTGAMLYQLSYEALLEAARSRTSSIYTRYVSIQFFIPTFISNPMFESGR